MSDLDNLYALKKKVENTQEEAQRAAGALAQELKNLSQQFDCETKEDAIKLLDVWSKRQDASSGKFQEEFAKFKLKYPDLLNEGE